METPPLSPKLEMTSSTDFSDSLTLSPELESSSINSEPLTLSKKEFDLAWAAAVEAFVQSSPNHDLVPSLIAKLREGGKIRQQSDSNAEVENLCSDFDQSLTLPLNQMHRVEVRKTLRPKGPSKAEEASSCKETTSRKAKGGEQSASTSKGLKLPAKRRHGATL